MHDLWYQYGFNEANRNFQTVNYEEVVRGNDAVNAEAQDASFVSTPSYNNANFQHHQRVLNQECKCMFGMQGKVFKFDGN